ncbi:MAG: hypothetical protein K2I90_01165 [Odoribacter sp.]|nr:hypothetical protein [Odoribacter sp.]
MTAVVRDSDDGCFYVCHIIILRCRKIRIWGSGGLKSYHKKKATVR